MAGTFPCTCCAAPRRRIRKRTNPDLRPSRDTSPAKIGFRSFLVEVLSPALCIISYVWPRKFADIQDAKEALLAAIED